MVADFEEGRLLGELQNVEDEMEAICKAMDYFVIYYPKVLDGREKYLKNMDKVIGKLRSEKERLEIRLKQHRQKVKESGIKF